MQSPSAAIISLILGRKRELQASKRNVVLHVVELARGLLGGRGRASLALALRFGPLLARLAAALATSEHLHRVRADLGAVAVLALLVLPLAGAQAAFDVDLRAFLQVFARDLRQTPEEGDAMPLGRLLHLTARLVLPLVGSLDADVGDRIAARRVAGLRVRA